ncbi:sialate O-acetylesterase [Geminisphaera colitermitum]|uniref:sialate O-acetylesterase n=1 Tax=Geminisphaera colitermitum TaxID=1148786 RepID=UPI000196539D|nr:sialate O-acetylesterase [Geminisphaera colitermitum]
MNYVATFFALTLFVSSFSCIAAPKPAALFSEHAVLQQGKPVPVWGTANPGEKIRVSWRDVSAETTTADDGRWRVILPALPSGQSADLIIAGDDSTLTIPDVIAGDVWLCSGQSNMVWHVNQAEGGRDDAKTANFPALRHFKVTRAKSPTPLTELEGEWQVASPKTVRGWSAVAFYFGRALHQQRGGTPVGLINTAWSGTDIEAWISSESIDTSPVGPAVRARWRELATDYPARAQKHKTDFAAWEKARAEAEAAGTLANFKQRKPRAPVGPGSSSEPSVIFNGEIHPLIPYALAGMIWYQGENNTPRSSEYAALQRSLIRDWRARWESPSLPFLYVQLPNYAASHKPLGTGWAAFRDEQARVLSEPATGMAITIDVGESGTVHPVKKREVGERLALLARAIACGEKNVPSSPRLLDAKPDAKNARLRLTFDTGGSPLVLRAAPAAADATTPPAFQIAGADGVFFPARVTLEGDNTIVLTNPSVTAPLHVRYAWINDPVATLFNQAGLPAAPFRTDGETTQ